VSEPVLLCLREGAVAVLTLNRPRRMNALDTELRLALGRAFRELEADPSVRVAILTGAGGRAFCAGMDLSELSAGAPGASGFEMSAAGQDEMSEGIAAFGGPIIAAVNRFAVTGGFELALACDLIVASTQASFSDTHARVGILPGWGLSQKLPRLIGIARAKELSLPGLRDVAPRRTRLRAARRHRVGPRNVVGGDRPAPRGSPAARARPGRPGPERLSPRCEPADRNRAPTPRSAPRGHANPTS